MLKKITYIFLTFLIGCIFILSGWTKLFPIEPFEFTFVDLGFINWNVAPFIARFLIAAEFLIGIFLIFQFNLKQFTFKIAKGILILFSAYLILLILIVGNKGNCGCFGSFIEMTPIQALIKNIGMLGILFYISKRHEGWNFPKKNKIISIIISLIIISTPFILNYVELDYAEAYLNKPENNYTLELDSLYKDASLNIPPKSLSNGKHIIAFMSLTCKHCRIAAKKIRIMHERNPDISFYIVLNGEEKNLKPFFDETHTENIPHCMLNGRNFVYLAGTRMPTILLINNSIVEFDVNYFDLNQDEIEKWMKK